MGKNLYRRGSGPMWWVALAVVTFSLYSLMIAASTADKCDGFADKSWEIAPPHWECHRSPGFG